MRRQALFGACHRVRVSGEDHPWLHLQWQGRLRPYYQYDSFQECNQAREAMAKDETGRHLWATCTRGKAPPPSVYQKEFQDQLMPGNFLKERR